MKAMLLKYTEDILEALGAQGIVVRIYDCEIDAVPIFAVEYERQSFMVCCSCNNARPDPDWLTRLERFIGKELFMSACEQEIYLYWFEAKLREPSNYKVDSDSLFPKTPSKFITHTYLPDYLGRYIFETLGAAYSPNYEKFSSNLGHTKKDILVYLGTYFPRSYAESFCIFNNMLQNSAITAMLQSKRNLNILSVGCGTGGDLLGLLSLLSEKFHNIERVTIQAADGNTDALSILEAICNSLREHCAFQVRLNTHTKIFEEKITSAFLENIEGKFDFILSFKMICEFLAKNSDIHKAPYYDFCKEFLPYLSSSGICLLLDVTTHIEGRGYVPTLLNSQVNNALRELGTYKTLLPLPCNLHESNCKASNCFSQKVFTVSHVKHCKGTSKVCYRVMVHKDFCGSAPIAAKDINYSIGKIVQRELDGGESLSVKTCQHTRAYNAMRDGYNLVV